MKEGVVLVDALAVLGGLLVVSGVALLSVPVALVVGGGLCMVAAWRLA